MPERYKALLLGPDGAGKACLLRRFTQQKSPDNELETHMPTQQLVSEGRTLVVDGQSLKLQLVNCPSVCVTLQHLMWCYCSVIRRLRVYAIG